MIFSAVILSLAGLSFQIAKRTTRATDQALTMAAQLTAADRATVVPFDSLVALLTPDTLASGSMRIITTYSVVSVTNVRRDVYVVSLSNIAGSRPDTIIVRRGLARDPIPLR